MEDRCLGYPVWVSIQAVDMSRPFDRHLAQALVVNTDLVSGRLHCNKEFVRKVGGREKGP